ncbi:unnamed protein product [Calypogeia fissa]
MWSPLTVEGVEVFGLAIYQCLQRWTALQLAIHNEWGGSSSTLKAQQFHSNIVAFFSRAKEARYIDDLEDLLDQCMLEFFNTEIEDGSLFEVAEQIMTMHEECMLGNYENVRRMSTPAPGSGQSVLDSREKVVEDEGENGNHQVTVSGDEEGMDMEQSLPTAAVPSSSTARPARASLLTEDEVADGWQEAPVRKGRRGKT